MKINKNLSTQYYYKIIVKQTRRDSKAFHILRHLPTNLFIFFFDENIYLTIYYY